MSGRLPAFPIDAFPHSLRHYCESVAMAVQAPLDMVAAVMLGTLSTVSLGARVNVGARSEELTFYTMVVLDATERKSAVMTEVTRPLHEIERRVREEQAEELSEARTRKELLEQKRKSLMAKHIRTDDNEERNELLTNILDLDKQLAMFGSLAPYRLLADDVTAEGLAWLLTQHGRMGILAAEGSAIDNIVGAQYGTSGKPSKLDVLLRAFSGERSIIDRRGSETQDAERPLLSITLTIQPQYLTGLIDDKRSRDLGLVSRFVYVAPPPATGNRLAEEDVDWIDPQWSDAWASALTHIHELLKGQNLKNRRNPSQEGGFGGFGGFGVNTDLENSLSLSLDSSCRKRKRELHYLIEPTIGVAGENVHMKDWVNRHVTRITKLAGLLHLGWRLDPEEPISLDTYSRAEEIGDFYWAHARAALTEGDAATLRARHVLDAWTEDIIKVGELRRTVFHGRPNTSSLAESLALTLVEEGVLELLPLEKRKNGGRPTAMYKINREHL